MRRNMKPQPGMAEARKRQVRSGKKEKRQKIKD
jgi:hypothetical protein